MLFWNKLIEYKEIPEKIPEFPEIWHKSPEIPELSKWLGIAISSHERLIIVKRRPEKYSLFVISYDMKISLDLWFTIFKNVM